MKKGKFLTLLLLLLTLLFSCTNAFSTYEEENALRLTLDTTTTSRLTKNLSRGEEDVILNVNWGIKNDKGEIALSYNKEIYLKEIGSESFNIQELPFDRALTFFIDISYNNLIVYTALSDPFTLTEDNTTLNINLTLKGVLGKITYDSPYSDNSIFYPDKYTIDSNTVLPTPKREGYYFSGWYLNKEFKGKPITVLSSDLFQGDIVLYAKWDSFGYKVIFNGNGAKEGEYIQTLNYGVKQKLDPQTFTKEYSLFNGWNTQKDGSGLSFKDCEEKVFNLSNKNGESVTLYAQWKPITYTVIYNGNGAKEADYKQTLSYGLSEKLNPATFTKEFSLFTGWNTKQDGTGITFTDGEEKIFNLCDQNDAKITLYAQWKPITYTVIYNGNGANEGEYSQTLTYGRSEKLNLSTFTKEYSNFTGWNTQKDGKGTSFIDGEEKVFNLCPNDGEVITLYAQWKSFTYTVNYDGNGANQGSYTQVLNYGASEKLKASTFTKSFYTFSGWNTSKDGNGTSFIDGEEKAFNLCTVDNGTVTLYAQWKPFTYTIEFNGNGAKEANYTQTLTYDRSEKLQPSTFTKQYADFIGWNIIKDGTGTSFTDGEEKAFNLCTQDKETITLYAQWDNWEKATTPVLSIDGVENSLSSLEVDYSSSLTLANITPSSSIYYTTDGSNPLDTSNVNRTEYTSAIFFEKEIANLADNPSGLTLKVASQKSKMIDSDVLTVTLKLKRYTVTFDANKSGVTSPSSQSLYKGQKVVNGSDLTLSLTGYVFGGWYTSSQCNVGEEFSFDNTTVDNSFTLYASWDPIVYRIVFHKNDGVSPEETVEQNVTYDTLPPLDTLSFTRKGYEFKEWRTVKDGTGDKYTDKQVLTTNLKDVSNAAFDLYAIWKDVTPPSGVTNLHTMAQDDGTSVLVAWINPSDPDFDKVVITYNGKTQEVLKSASVNDSAVITGLTEGSKITVEVQTVDNAEIPNYSSKQSVYAFPNKPYVLHEAPVALRSGSSTYLFGDYPQTIMDSDVKLQGDKTKNINGKTYILGNDNRYYLKVVNPSTICEGDQYFSDYTSVSTFGTYYFQLEPVKWKELAASGQLIAEDALFGMSYDEAYTSDYLQNTFMPSVFTSTAQGKLKIVEGSRKVSLLSKSDLLNTGNGFSSDVNNLDSAKKRYPTDYALVSPIYKDQYNGHSCWWWLRDSGQCVANAGDAHLTNSTSNRSGGVIPVIKVQ